MPNDQEAIEAATAWLRSRALTNYGGWYALLAARRGSPVKHCRFPAVRAPRSDQPLAGIAQVSLRMLPVFLGH